ncbi:MAG: Uncharacterized protein G01um101425_679 [Candidatus Peregrinibacteria bacterium Gr01-1014_25]|nr:MAG: Uncharacterized protein G01um101425_679 [Candidatus Peregrinibacteria bacterium Gr01-1014_25]
MDTQTPTTTADAPEQGVTMLLSWDAPLRQAHERSKRWYMIAGGLVILVAAYSLLTGSWSTAVVAVLLGCIYYLLHGTQPPLKHISLTSHGVYFDGAFTRWEDCTGFWFVIAPGHQRLHIGRKDRKQGDIAIMVENVDAEKVRWTLSQFLSEQTNRSEHFLDTIIRICKL